MAKTIRVCPDKNGVVRNVQLLIGLCNGTKTVFLQTNTQNYFTC